MENYKPNSHKYKAEQKAASDEKRVEKIVKSNVKVKKKNGLNKLTDNFVSDDAKNIKSYVVFDVLIPAVKKAISDIVTNGIDMILYGETGRSKKKSNVSYVSYDRFSSDRRDEPRYNSASRNRYRIDDIILETRAEADAVLSRMQDVIDTYGVVRVADLYDLVGITGEYTDNKYGWTNIANSAPVRARGGGYMLDLPRALPI